MFSKGYSGNTMSNKNTNKPQKKQHEDYLTKPYLIITVYNDSDSQVSMFITKSHIKAKNEIFDSLFYRYGVDPKSSNHVRMEECHFESEFNRDYPNYPKNEWIEL